MVAELVSEDVDKDVLLPNRPRPRESSNAFRHLGCDTPFWQNVTSQSRASWAPGSS